MQPKDSMMINPVTLVADELDADIYLVSGEIDRSLASSLIEEYASGQQRPNCALILSTYGGDADAAYIIARFLKRVYKHFTLYVFGHCKSAGTLVALGADEIVMSVRAELGPLDVQLFKEDELGRQSSGLDIFQALTIINGQAYQIWENNFLRIKAKSGGVITTKTAADIATSLATQLLSPISAQIDPLRLGEMQRAINIARQYGERLGAKPETVAKLIHDYPSHNFVIDYEEAITLFPAVRPPTQMEQLLEQALRDSLLEQCGGECIHIPHPEGLLACLTQKADIKEQDDADLLEEPGIGAESIGLGDRSADQPAIQSSFNHHQPVEQNNEHSRFGEARKNGHRKVDQNTTTSN